MTSCLSAQSAQTNTDSTLLVGRAFERTLPEVVVNRAGCFALANRLVVQGKLEAADVFLWLLHQVEGSANYGGYRLPWRSLEEMVRACTERGFSLEAAHFLFCANLLDYPQGECPAVLYARPGYSGDIREVRNGSKVWLKISACLS
jgi:hypothetical protein